MGILTLSHQGLEQNIELLTGSHGKVGGSDPASGPDDFSQESRSGTWPDHVPLEMFALAQKSVF